MLLDAGQVEDPDTVVFLGQNTKPEAAISVSFKVKQDAGVVVPYRGSWYWSRWPWAIEKLRRNMLDNGELL